jgi:hypothetical protein
MIAGGYAEHDAVEQAREQFAQWLNSEPSREANAITREEMELRRELGVA